MGRKKKKSGRGSGEGAAIPPEVSATKPREGVFQSAYRGRWLAAGLAAIAMAFAGFLFMPLDWKSSSTPAGQTADTAQSRQPAEYVGAASCKQCHEAEFKAWTGSHHELAMQVANASTVLGNFDGAKFKYFDVESTFFKRDGKFMVRTDSANGKLADFEVKHTFGVTPLQQYLIEFPEIGRAHV